MDAWKSARAVWLALVPALFGALCLAAAGASAQATSPSGGVNVNTATEEELQQLPGIGQARARALVALRKSRGGFKSLEELMEVRGIGEAGLERLRPFVRLEGRSTAARP